MKNFKKALVGTALAGALVVGAGFGTYSWFTSEATVSGSIQNTVINISPDRADLNLNVIDAVKLAPSRIAMSDYVHLKNNSTEDTRLTINYTSNLQNGGPTADLSMYRSAAIFRIGIGNDEVNSGKDEEAIKKLLDSDKTSLTKNDLMELYQNVGLNGNIFLLDGSESDTIVLQEIENALANNQPVTIFAGPPSWVTPGPGGKPENPGLSGPTSLLPNILFKDDDIKIIYGVKLSENAGNDYQAAQLSVQFDVKLSQTDEPVSN